MTDKVRDGTPYHGGKGLCHSCKHSQVFRGGPESDITVRCQTFYEQPIFITRPVVECSDYASKVDKSLYEMKQIGWVLATKNGKTIGFVSAREAKKKSEDGEIDNVEID